MVWMVHRTATCRRLRSDAAQASDAERTFERPPRLRSPSEVIQPRGTTRLCSQTRSGATEGAIPTSVKRKGESGARQEHLRALLENERTADNLYYFASQLARGRISEDLRAGLAVASLTALRKTDEAGRPTDDIRGIATGITIRRLTARTIAQPVSYTHLTLPTKA